jgi:hypothetical protein
MTNEKIKTLLANIDYYCNELRTGIKNNMADGEYYSSKEYHESVLNKVEAIKLILKV